jgi:hypothetical protein
MQSFYSDKPRVNRLINDYGFDVLDYWCKMLFDKYLSDSITLSVSVLDKLHNYQISALENVCKNKIYDLIIEEENG